MAVKRCRKGFSFCAGCLTQKPETSMGTVTYERTGRRIIRCFDCIMADLTLSAGPDFVYQLDVQPAFDPFLQLQLFPTPITGDDEQ